MRGIITSALALTLTVIILYHDGRGQTTSGQNPPIIKPPPPTQQDVVLGKGVSPGFPGQMLPGQLGPYYGMNQNPWFNQPDIRTQLNLNSNQMAALNNAYTTQFGQYSQGIAGIGALTDKERIALSNQMWNKFNTQMGTAAQVTLNPEQLQRFNQLNTQFQGNTVFANPQVQQQLQLTPDQQQRLQTLTVDQNNQLNTIFQLNNTDPVAANKQYIDWRQQGEVQLKSILTDPQRQAWQQMTGEPFYFTPDWMQMKK